MSRQGEKHVVEARLAHGERHGDDSFAVECTQRVANQTAVFNAFGYERPATPDELAL